MHDSLPNVARTRAEAAGEVGRRWLRDLDETVRVLATRWKLHIGDALPGGSESLVLAVRREDGADAILKIGVPGVADFEGEARAYELSGGRGLATLLHLLELGIEEEGREMLLVADHWSRLPAP